MKINLNYDDDDSDSSENEAVEEVKEEANANEEDDVSNMQALLGSTSSPAPDNTELDSDDSSISDNDLLGTTNPVTALEEEDSWQFDLGVMDNKNKRVEEQALKTSTYHERGTNDYEEAMSKVSMMSDDLTVLSLELEEADRAIKNLLLGKENEVKEFRRNPVRRTRSCDHVMPGVLTPDFLEKRKLDRAARLQRARERIARDKTLVQEKEKQAEEKRKQEEAKQKEFDMSEEARRDRIYQWYSRCGQPNRKELKRRVAAIKHKEGVTVEDVDLLPWNFNGSMINVSKMLEYQLGNCEE